VSRIWIGDWLRAHRALGDEVTDADRRALTAMLELAPPTAPPIATVAAGQPADNEPTEPTADVAEPPSDPGAVHTPQHHERVAAEGSRLGELVLSRTKRDTRNRPTLEVDGTLPPPSLRIPRLPHEPLFERGLSRTLLAAVAATRHPEGAILIRESVDVVAQRRPMRDFPRRMIATVRSGLAVVLVRAGLEPFADDVLELSAQLRHVVGTGGVAEWWLEARRLVPRRRPATWPPATGTPCMFVTVDASDPRVTVEARTLIARSSPVIALVPGRRARPTELPRGVAFVHWDHRTRVREVLRAREVAQR
jgi:hypothetical protein